MFGRTVDSISSGGSTSCLIYDNGDLYCWGRNNQGQLGIGSTTTQSSPQLVNLGIGRTAKSVSLSGYHTCAILDDGSVKCWGQNPNGANLELVVLWLMIIHS